MFNTKQDIDKHVRTHLSKLSDNEVSWIFGIYSFSLFSCAASRVGRKITFFAAFFASNGIFWGNFEDFFVSKWRKWAEIREKKSKMRRILGISSNLATCLPFKALRDVFCLFLLFRVCWNPMACLDTGENVF